MASVSSYHQAIQRKIDHFTDIPVMRNFLSEKVNRIALERFRNIEAPAVDAEICADFNAAVEHLHAVEHHVFNINAPPSLVPAALHGPDLPLSFNQSILRHSVRSASEILSIAKAFHITDSIRGIVPLSTERLVMHNLTRRFVLNYSLKDELSKELVKVIKPLTQRVIRENNCYQGLRDQIEGQVLLYLETGNPNGLDGRLRESAEELLKQAQSQPSELCQKELYEAVAKRTADLVVETFVKQIVDGYDMSAAPELAGYKPLPNQTSKTRRIFMINGGVASGKSSAQAIEAERAKGEGVEWEDVCQINRDAFKPMLLSPRDIQYQYKEFFASFTEDEAYLLRDAILRDYKARLIDDTAPHLHIDQVSPTIEMMRMAGQPVAFSLLCAINNDASTGV